MSNFKVQSPNSNIPKGESLLQPLIEQKAPPPIGIFTPVRGVDGGASRCYINAALMVFFSLYYEYFVGKTIDSKLSYDDISSVFFRLFLYFTAPSPKQEYDHREDVKLLMSNVTSSELVYGKKGDAMLLLSYIVDIFIKCMGGTPTKLEEFPLYSGVKDFETAYLSEEVKERVSEDVVETTLVPSGKPPLRVR